MTPEEDKLRDEVKLRLGTALAPMLLAVAIFSLTLMNSEQSPGKTYVDELCSLLSILCLLGAATATDSVMDRCNFRFVERFQLLGGGYLLFCLAIGCLSAATPVLYAAKANPSSELTPWHRALCVVTGIAAVVKLLQSDEKWWTILMFLLYVATAIVAIIHVLMPR